MKYCLYMCCHNGFGEIPPLFTPIQCGAALNPAVPGAISDADGDSISELNREYCELTAHYYAWKNVSADRYGFCHYRRFFAFGASGLRVKQPYFARGKLTSREIRLLGSEEQLIQLMENCNIIAPGSEDMGLTAAEHYCTAIHHFAEDLALFREILCSRAPQLARTVEEYLSQPKQYFCNMFIMDREHFNEYCDILFSSLAEFDRRKKRHGYFQGDRTDGYLGELFTGIYITWAKDRGASVAEIPRLDVYCSWKKRLGAALLPPQTKRRFAAKQLYKMLKK